MYNLFRFLKKYSYILMFLILEALCIILLINNLPYQKRKLTNAGNAIAGKFFKTKFNFSNYFSLKEENQLLTEHNAMLLGMLSTAHDTSSFSIIESSRPNYKYIPANVIDNDIYKANNYMLIDKGSKKKIKKDMGVICENGIVGKVANVSKNYSSIISLLHSYTVVSARFTNNQHLANVCWENIDYRFGTVKDIPLHLTPQRGDTLVTSGYSNIYPADIMIGTIDEMYDNKSKDFNTAKIRFSTNFSTLRHVYVIENLNQNEIDSLISNR